MRFVCLQSILAFAAVLVSSSSFALTILPASEWETIRLDEDYIAIGNSDKSRRPSAIEQSTAGDIEIPSELQSRKVVSIGEQAFCECKNITSVAIPFGVTNIDNRAFYNCTSLTNVVIPSSVKSIGVLAFYGCSKLQKAVVAGESAISIGSAAFMNCSSLSAVEVSATDSIELNAGAFSGCTGARNCLLKAKDVAIADNAFSFYQYDSTHSGGYFTSLANVVVAAQLSASVGASAFSRCTSLAEATITAGTTASVGNYAFSGCTSLAEATITAGATASIGNGAFSGCTSLAEATITAGTTASIGNGAFSYCGKLVNVTLPDVLATISDNTFLQCSSLKEFVCPTNLTQISYRAFDTCTSLESFEFDNRLKTIADQAFYGCNSLSELEFPQSVGEIGSRAFEKCTALASVEFKEGDTNLTSSASVEIGDRAFYACSAVTNIVFSQKVKSFGSRAFAENTALVSVVLPTNLTAVSERAFENCGSLSTLDLPPALETIGIEAFRGCTSYAEFGIPTNRMVDVGTRAFFRTKYWDEWEDDSLVVNNGYMLGFKGNPVSVVLPDTCKAIPSGMFENMTNLTTVIIPPSVVSVGSRAFANSGVSSIDIASVSEIGISAFDGCTRLQKVVLSPDLTSIPNNAFMNCSCLVAIDIPSGVTSIGDYAFYNCTSLRTASGGDSVVSIGDYAFANCTALEAKRFASDVVYGVHVFQGCTWEEYVLFPSVGTLQTEYPESYSKIRSVVFPSGQTNIVENACSGCSSLEYINIPSSVASVGANAFSGCVSVTSVVMVAGLSDVGSNAFNGCSAIVSATVSGSVPVKTLFPEKYDTLKDLKIAQGCEVLCADLFNGCAAMETIDIPRTVTSIGDRAFYGCTALGANGALITEQIDSIGDQAFAYCSSLEYINIPSSVASVGESAFSGCVSVTSVVMVAGLSDVGSNAFNGCSAIVSATVSGSVPVKTLFPEKYDTLKDLKIAQGCEVLCADLFNGCAAMETIDIPRTVTSIGDRAFYGCTALGANGVLITEQVDSIGDQAFAYCSSLKAVRFLCAQPTSIATNIYYKANDDLITAVLQPYKDSWQSSMSNSWPVAQNTVCGRKIMWWDTDCLAKITYAYYNGTGDAEYQYYLKNAGRTINKLPDITDDTKKYGDFVGWFTKPYGGDEVEEGMEVTTSMTLYAHWSVNEADDDDDDDDDDDGDDYDFSSAHVYNGYVLDGDALVGSVRLKIARGRYSRVTQENTAVATATFQLLGEGRVAVKGVLREDATGGLVHSKSSRQFSFSVDGESVSGSFDDLDVVAVKDVFSSSEKSDRATAAALISEVAGNYNVVLPAESDGEYSFSGYAGVSLQIGKRGTAKISGFLPDGTKLSATAPIVCDDEIVLIPAVLPAYIGKKGGIAFVLFLSDGDAAIDNVSDWIGPNGSAIGSLEAGEVAKVSPMSNGEYVFAADISDFEFDGETIDDSLSPDGTLINVQAGKWSTARADVVRFVRDEGFEISRDNGNPSGLRLSCTAKTGLFRGKFQVYSVAESGRSKKRTATVFGIVVNGVGYGCASIKKIGAIPIRVE